MGNHVGVFREPPQLADLFPLRGEEYVPNGEHSNMYHDDGFRSYIQMWRFYSDAADDMFIKNSPVKLGAFKKFDSRDCYIALHIFKNYGDYKQSSSSPSPSSTSSSSSSSSSFLDGTPSLHDLVSSSIEELTPRGIASSFGTLSLEPFIHTSREDFTHDLYVWNGKASTPLAKAVALAKGFEIERVLVKEKTTGTVYRRFARSPKSPLSSVFRDDIEENTKHYGDPKRYDVNHLFRQLLNPYKRSSSIKIGELFGTSHTVDPSRFEVLRKSIHKFEPGTSSPSPPSSRHSHETPRKHPKVPALSLSSLPLSSPQQQIDDATPRPKVPPIPFVKSATEGSLTALKKRLTPSLSFESLKDPVYTVKDPDEYVEEDFSTWEPSKLLERFEPLLSQILDFLFLSSRVPTGDRNMLKTWGVTHILNCAGAACTNHFPDDFVYKTYYISDSSGEDITCLFYETIDFIEEARLKGGKVLIHCHQGVSRSSSFVILYLMWQFRWDFNKAHEWVRAIRYISNPNPGFTGQLILWFKKMQELPLRPRPTAIPPPSQPPPQPRVHPSQKEVPWGLPLATPRNSSSSPSLRYEPIATPRGARGSDPCPTPRSTAPSFSSVIPQTPRSNSDSARPPPIPTIPTNIMTLPLNFSTPTPGEPPPLLRGTSDLSSTIPMIPTLYMHQPKTLIRTASDPTPSTSPPPIPFPTRLYRLVSHSQNSFVVPKLVPEPLTFRSLDPRGGFILCTTAQAYLWVGSRCPSVLYEGARRVVEKLQRFEGLSPLVEEIRQGCEPGLFWGYFAGGIGEVVENIGYREYMQVGAQSPGRREQVPATQGGERAELYKYEDHAAWVPYGVEFDEEDLDSDGIYVLYVQQPRHVWVWIGKDYNGKWGKDGEVVDGLLVARQFRNDLQLPDEGDVTIIKSVVQETDEFLSHFH